MQERQERRIRQIRRQVDWQWLNACLGSLKLKILTYSLKNVI